MPAYTNMSQEESNTQLPTAVNHSEESIHK